LRALRWSTLHPASCTSVCPHSGHATDA
jgi:hypothetical protein